MIVDAGWNVVQIFWDRETGRLDVFVGVTDPDRVRTNGHHGRFHAVRTTADVSQVVAEVLASEQLRLPT